MPMIFQLFAGAIVLGCWAIALFFFRFWRKTGDRLFVFFASAFLLLGIERIVLALLNQESDYKSWAYLIRLAAFLLIFFAIITKNGMARKKP